MELVQSLTDLAFMLTKTPEVSGDAAVLTFHDATCADGFIGCLLNVDVINQGQQDLIERMPAYADRTSTLRIPLELLDPMKIEFALNQYQRYYEGLLQFGKYVSSLGAGIEMDRSGGLCVVALDPYEGAYNASMFTGLSKKCITLQATSKSPIMIYLPLGLLDPEAIAEWNSSFQFWNSLKRVEPQQRAPAPGEHLG